MLVLSCERIDHGERVRARTRRYVYAARAEDHARGRELLLHVLCGRVDRLEYAAAQADALVGYAALSCFLQNSISEIYI